MLRFLHTSLSRGWFGGAEVVIWWGSRSSPHKIVEGGSGGEGGKRIRYDRDIDFLGDECRLNH